MGRSDSADLPFIVYHEDLFHFLFKGSVIATSLPSPGDRQTQAKAILL